MKTKSFLLIVALVTVFSGPILLRAQIIVGTMKTSAFSKYTPIGKDSPNVQFRYANGHLKLVVENYGSHVTVTVYNYNDCDTAAKVDQLIFIKDKRASDEYKYFDPEGKFYLVNEGINGYLENLASIEVKN